MTDVEVAEKVGVSRDSVRKYGRPEQGQENNQTGSGPTGQAPGSSIAEAGDVVVHAREAIARLPDQLKGDSDVAEKVKELALAEIEAKISEAHTRREEADQDRLEKASYQASLALRTVRDLEASLYGLCECGEPLRLTLKCAKCGARYLVKLPDGERFEVLRAIRDGEIQI